MQNRNLFLLSLLLFLITLMVLLPKTSVNASKNDLFLSIASDSSVYKEQSTPAIAITLLNSSKKTRVLEFVSSKQFDIQLLDNNDKLIGTWSQGLMFSQAFTSIKLQPQQPLTRVYTWNLRNLDVFPLIPGKYKLVAVLNTTKNKLFSKPLEIEFK